MHISLLLFFSVIFYSCSADSPQDGEHLYCTIIAAKTQLQMGSPTYMLVHYEHFLLHKTQELDTEVDCCHVKKSMQAKSN